MSTETQNYLNAINNKIKNLIIERAEAHGNQEEQDRINTVLTKLYDVKHTIYIQQNN